ncbi:MAG TPA: inorganic diphosphatase [Mucilaginibacter sp.]
MKTFTVVIETPKGSTQKYDYEEKLHGYRLAKIMPTGMIFPYDFGFVPDTKGSDGDPLDVIVISEFHSFPGCVIECRIIGCMLAEQQSKKGMVRNDRFIAVPELSLVFSEVENVSDMPDKLISELCDFFANYNRAEQKEFKTLGIVDAKEAKKLIKKSLEASD